MCCAAEIFGKKLFLLNAVDIYVSSMIHCDANWSLFFLHFLHVQIVFCPGGSS